MYLPHSISRRISRSSTTRPIIFPNFFSRNSGPESKISRLEIEFMNDKLVESKNRAKLSRHNSPDKPLPHQTW